MKVIALLLFFWPYFFGGIAWTLFNKNKARKKEEEKSFDAEDAEIIEEWKK